VLAEISDDMMREQSRAKQAYFVYVCEHKAVPPKDSLIARHLERAFACDPPGTVQDALCEKGIDLIHEAIRGYPDSPPLANAIEGFETWLRASDVHRATFLGHWEEGEVYRQTPLTHKLNLPLSERDAEYRDQARRIEREIYQRHRYEST
jgi:hypothetical protein